MKLSKESQYGLTGVLALADRPLGTVLSVAEVATATGLAQPFLAKVFQRLTRGGVLRSHRGRAQGYALALPAEEISVKAVAEAIEGPQLFRHCVFWSDACSEAQPCLLHESWRDMAERERALMASITIADLREQRAHAADGGRPEAR